ncbi:MAG TPA: N-acetylmuramoyl-L-alanine amidase [Rhodanobacteraceae bacterium]
MTADLTLHEQPLPYVAHLQQRKIEDVELVVIHCTELPDLATARSYGERVVHQSGTGNSGHFYIDRDGSAYRYVPAGRVAHHVRGHNEHSIGIELVNTGRFPDWFDSRRQVMTEAYSEAQLDALLALLARLHDELPNLHWITGHEDLDTDWVAASDAPSRQVRRKLDPGPMFPWPHILAKCALARLAPAVPPV